MTQDMTRTELEFLDKQIHNLNGKRNSDSEGIEIEKVGKTKNASECIIITAEEKGTVAGSRVNGICVIVLSCLFLDQSVNLLVQQRLDEAFKVIHRQPFKNHNWMKSAVPLMVSAVLGILIGIFQSISSLISLILDYSKHAYQRKLGWLIWIGGGMCVFILSCISFVLAQILKAHEYRDPNDSASFWTNYRSAEKATHNFEGHAFCSALVLNSASLLGCMAIVAGRVFRQTHMENHPHLLLGM